MAERRAATKGRRMGSSRRKQLHEGSGEALAAVPGPSEEPPWASEIVKRVQDFFREQDKDHEGFVTRSDMMKLQEEDFPCSMEELKLVFDGLDAAGTGRLSTEEFTAGLRQFLNSQKAARDHRRRKTASRRVRLVLPNLTLEGANSEERRHFAAFVDQLGTDNISEEQEIWQLWVKLRQDEPQLLGNLEDFLAKMRHRIQEARSKKEALEVTLNKRVVEHDKEVQQLCEALEQQIKQEQQRLQQESVTRSHQHSAELQRVLDASEREVQRLVTAQMELETRCRSLRSTQQATSTENRQLEESNRVLEDRLQHLHQQLQQTHRHLQTARASVVWEHREEPGDRAVAELPSEMPLSPQMSPGKSEKYRSEMRIRLGSQSGEPKAKSTHQVVWEVPPAEINILGAPTRVSSAEEDPFPEFLKEEHFSDQSSLLREMNDAIAALSKQLKPQASGAPPDAAHHPRDDAEPQMGPEAATAHGTTPSVLQETLPGHISPELVEGDLKEGLATAELRAPDVTQAGASVGARHHRAQEPGAEQGESPEEAWRMLFLQGKGAGVKELMLKVAEHPQGAPGESTEAGKQALLEVEGEGWMQEKTGWEKAQPPGEAEEAALSQGENLEAGLGPPEAGDTGLAAEWQFVTDEPGPAAALGERAQPLGTGLGEEAEPPSRLSEELEVKPGERLEPEPPSRGEARMGAAQGDGDCHPEMTVAPDPTMLGEEHISADVQHWGETLDTDELPAQAQHGGSRRAGAKEGEVEATQPREADLQRQGESARGEAAWGGTVGAEVPAAVPLADMWEGGAGTDVQLLEAHSSDANMQLLAEVEAALQPLSEGGSPGMGQAGSVDPDVQPLEEVDKPELGLGEEMGAAAVHGEGPSPGEPSAGSPDVCGLFPVMAQALELVEPEDSQADVQLCGGISLETSHGGGDHAATQRMQDSEEGTQGHEERGLPHEPVLPPHGVTIRQGEGAGTGVQPQGEAESLDMLEDRGTDANVQLIAEADEVKLTPGGSTEAEHTQHGAEDGAQGQGEHELPHEPVLNPQGAGVGQGEGADAGVQPWEGAESLAVLEEQSTAANVQLIAEVDELKLTPEGSMEAVLQPLSEAGSPGTEQGGSLDPDVQPLVKADKPELVEMVEAEESQADRQLCEHPSLETPQGGEDHAAMQHGDGDGDGDEDEDEDGTQGQGEHELPREPVLNPQGLGIRQGEGADAGVIPREEAESLDVLEEQGTAVNVQLIAEIHELKLTPGGSTGTDLQSLRETDSLGTEQGGNVAPDFEPLYKIDKPELVEVELEDTQLCEHPSQETLQGGGHNAATQIMKEADGGAQGHGECGLPHGPELPPHGVTIRQGEGAGTGVQPWKEAESLDMLEDRGTDANVQLIAEADEVKLTPGGSTEAEHTQRRGEDEDGAQGQGEHELPHEPVLNLQGVGVGHGEGADAGVQPWEGAESLAVLEDQGSAANVQLNAEADELKLTPGGSTEVVLQPLSKAGSPGTEQGWSLDPDVQPLDQVDQQVLVELEIEDAQADMQLRGSLSPEPPHGGQRGAATQHEDEDEDGAQGQGEHELPHEPVLDAQGARIGQGEGADAGVRPWEEDESLDVLEEQSTAANVQLTAEVEESGGSAEADLAPLGAAGMREGEQSQTPVSEAALCAPHTTDAWEKAAGAHVSPPAEVTVHPESATAAEVPGLEAKLGALTGPDGQILEDTQPLELPQGEGDAVEGRPLGGAEDLEVVQGERLEAWARSLVEGQGPGIKQGYDDRVSALASPVSEVPLQISTLKLETMMQEDVLIPDVRRLGASGQAAQSELQEQVSAQADKVRLHTASQPPEEKPPHVMETEQVAAGPAEPPQQEVPPVSTLQMKVQQEEDAGNSQLGVVLKDSSLGDAANSSTQPQRQLLGEQREDLNVGQQEKQQEVGRKTTRKGEPSPGEPGAVTADGAGPAPRGSAEACLDPDHLYNVLFVGNSHVGKTSFLYRLHANAFNPHLTTTVGLDYQVKMLVVDNKRFALRLWDSAGTERYHSITKQFFRKADGVVLMYDITSEHSFSDMRYWLSCIQEGAKDRVAILLLGNKTDCAAERRVPTKEGERLAKEHQLMFYECSAASGHNVSESMVSLIRLLKVCEDKLKTEAEEVPKPPQKKKGCC